jgi:predicted restriction endonuclease
MITFYLIDALTSYRLDKQNSIVLNILHDKAFDLGLITFDEDLRLVCPFPARPLHQ